MHVLSILSAFILSQDQTLRSIYITQQNLLIILHQFIVVFALIVFLYSVANVLIHQFRSLADKVYITTNNIFRQYFFKKIYKNFNFYKKGIK